MASTNPLYTPWDSSPYETDLVKVQSIVNYCASRFRSAAAALSVLRLTDADEGEEYFGHFCSELVCICGYLILFLLKL